MARKLDHLLPVTAVARALLAAATCLGIACLGSPVAAAQTPENPVPVEAGRTSPVAVSQSNVLATCTPPAFFNPNPTIWTVSNSEVQLGGLPDPDGVPAAGHLLSVTVPPNLEPGRGFFISWTGNTPCVSFNGIMYFTVTGASTPPAPPPGQASPVDPSVIPTCPITSGLSRIAQAGACSCPDLAGSIVRDRETDDRALRFLLESYERRIVRAVEQRNLVEAQRLLAEEKRVVGKYLQNVGRARRALTDAPCESELQVEDFERLYQLLEILIQLEDVRARAELYRIGVGVANGLFVTGMGIIAAETAQLTTLWSIVTTGALGTPGAINDFAADLLLKRTEELISVTKEEIAKQRSKILNSAAATGVGAPVTAPVATAARRATAGRVNPVSRLRANRESLHGVMRRLVGAMKGGDLKRIKMLAKRAAQGAQAGPRLRSLAIRFIDQRVDLSAADLRHALRAVRTRPATRLLQRVGRSPAEIAWLRTQSQLQRVTRQMAKRPGNLILGTADANELDRRLARTLLLFARLTGP